MPTIIYKLADPETHEVRYVGKTCKSIKERLKCHIATARRKNHRHVCCWINSLTKAGLSPEASEIETVPDDQDWVTRERFWISHYRDSGSRLTNHTDGGEGMSGHVASEETRRKISVAHKGKTISPENRKAQSIRMTGRRLTEAHKLNVAIAMRARVMTPEHKESIRASAKYRKKPDVSGEMNPRSKITKEQATEIRSGTYKLEEAKEKFGISKTQYYRIKRGEQWT